MRPVSTYCGSCRLSSSASQKSINCLKRLLRFSTRRRREYLSYRNGHHKDDHRSDRSTDREKRSPGCCGHRQGGAGELAVLGEPLERQTAARGSSSTTSREDVGTPVPETVDKNACVVRSGYESLGWLCHGSAHGRYPTLARRKRRRHGARLVALSRRDRHPHLRPRDCGGVGAGSDDTGD